MVNQTALYWFTNDLRLQDNALLSKAARDSDRLVCLFCRPHLNDYLRRYAQVGQFGHAKHCFLEQSLTSLDDGLKALGQRLFVSGLPPLVAMIRTIEHLGITHLYCNHSAGSDEQKVVSALSDHFEFLTIVQQPVGTLYEIAQLPFDLSELPKTFTQFRKRVETLPIELQVSKIDTLPPSPSHIGVGGDAITPWMTSGDFVGGEFVGGEGEALVHCQRYFARNLASHYKQTRNGLDGKDYSTKFSPWLAHGCIAPKHILRSLVNYEQSFGRNDSTYWIFFELLWREYFYWYARQHREKLFSFSGIHGKSPLTSFYPSRFKAWQEGKTPYPLVNACMNQLSSTGYMSNRGRQLVASCLVHELEVDWRYGAAYFESQLIDYDVASNWANWQYIAGVGADPQGSRRFNLEKQTEIYDPNREFINQWTNTEDRQGIDVVDMVDWPIMVDSSNR
ncbi:DASH family cryptochrome [Vibrio sp. SCSIO 43136]|uniref:DASH family cryptochrome n=1 Tax=Vibrio sp. SCSIO 43136 TaxID=2819101 RepID=UPI0020762823|nr:DASH family cryptochrome [Vibrio sp. SCSIO 43136]USD67326.1 DASH family cryptochrome [Vibrio sp. SCSIO 43136]